MYEVLLENKIRHYITHNGATEYQGCIYPPRITGISVDFQTKTAERYLGLIDKGGRMLDVYRYKYEFNGCYISKKWNVCRSWGRLTLTIAQFI